MYTFIEVFKHYNNYSTHILLPKLGVAMLKIKTPEATNNFAIHCRKLMTNPTLFSKIYHAHVPTA